MDLSGDEARLGSHDGVVGPLWFAYAAVFVAPRVALGVELATLGSQEHSLEYANLVTRDKYSASAIYGVVRARAVKSTRVSLDLLAGIGRQTAHFEYSVTRLASAASPSQGEYDDHYWMYALGADAPISVVPHFVVSPFARMYFLRGYAQTRSEQSSAQTAFSVGVTAGVAW